MRGKEEKLFKNTQASSLTAKGVPMLAGSLAPPHPLLFPSFPVGCGAGLQETRQGHTV